MGSNSKRGLIVLAFLFVVCPARAQTGGGYDLTHNTIDGGGATFSSGGGYRVGGTIGQPDAGVLSAGAYALNGGFWPGVIEETTPTPTATGTSTRTASPDATRTSTVTSTPSVTVTGTQPATPTRTRTATATATPTPSATGSVPPSPTPTGTGMPTSTPTATGSPEITDTPTPSPTPPPCVGDCDGDGTVTIDELLRGVNIALGNQALDVCPAFDRSGDERVTVEEVIAAVNAALLGCAG